MGGRNGGNSTGSSRDIFLSPTFLDARHWRERDNLPEPQPLAEDQQPDTQIDAGTAKAGERPTDRSAEALVAHVHIRAAKRRSSTPTTCW